MSDATSVLERTPDGTPVLRLSGRWALQSDRPQADRIAQDSRAVGNRLLVQDAGITEWDTSLLLFLDRLRKGCAERDVELDEGGLPEGVRRLRRLAAAVPERTDARPTGKGEPALVQVGNRAIGLWAGGLSALGFLGEATLSLGRFLTGRASYRRVELWQIIEECGPRALPIVATISVLVGAILASVGAVQLSMFGAEVFVADLVGLGMVIEMGALMTGIILAGRTGAAFAAQLGAMQVNEEIDALRTLGISPMDYLVLPRMLALFVMTPLLCIFADVLGILGGAVVGVLFLDIPAVLFLNQTLSSMTLWYCAQGLIKGATFGVLIAVSGCMRGMQCGRSASAVGDAATSAVVTGIVLIVLSDAAWTLIFMLTG